MVQCVPPLHGRPPSQQQLRPLGSSASTADCLHTKECKGKVRPWEKQLPQGADLQVSAPASMSAEVSPRSKPRASAIQSTPATQAPEVSLPFLYKK